MKTAPIGSLAAAAAVAIVALSSGRAGAVEAQRARFGVTPDGREVPSVTLSNAHGVRITVIAYGAVLQSVVLPDRAGRFADVAPGYAGLDGYLARSQMFGATVGRYANRIAGGRFRLDGEDYQLPVNAGPNSMHGGKVGFDKAVWAVVSVKAGPVASVTLRHVSPDGDQGYPGTLTVDATYSLDENNVLTIEYKATTDKRTIVNMTNHAYWNLSGEGSDNGAMGTVVTIPAESYLPADATSIPTGEFRPVTGTDFDFRTPHVINARLRDGREPQLVFARGYDHNFIFGTKITADQHLMARAYDPVSGRGFELWSNQPGLQFYTGNSLNGSSAGKSGKMYRQGDAFAFEPEFPPDTPNQPNFGSARLAPGETYRNVISYRFTVDRRAGSPPAR
jgi:aldose 1-epimerase